MFISYVIVNMYIRSDSKYYLSGLIVTQDYTPTYFSSGCGYIKRYDVSVRLELLKEIKRK